MPIADLQKMRPDVRTFMEEFQGLQLKFSIQYAVERAPEMMQLWPKVVQHNEMILTQHATISDVWKAFTKEELVIMANAVRYVLDQTAAIAMEKKPLPENVRLEKIDAGGIPSEIQIVPEATKDRVMLFLHGGGAVAGSVYEHRPLSIALGMAAKMQVLSIDYRLAPEHPFPAGLEDCTVAYQWLLAQGHNPKNIVVAGPSGGGLLTLALIHNLRSKNVELPRGIVCMSPGVDYSEIPESVYTNAVTDPMLADIGLFWWIISYLGVEKPADTTNMLVSPLLGDFHGFPPMLVQATSCEMLFEGGRMVVEKARAAGVDATLQAWDGLIHVWQLYALDVLPESRDAINKAGVWIDKLFTS